MATLHYESAYTASNQPVEQIPRIHVTAQWLPSTLYPLRSYQIPLLTKCLIYTSQETALS